MTSFSNDGHVSTFVVSFQMMLPLIIHLLRHQNFHTRKPNLMITPSFHVPEGSHTKLIRSREATEFFFGRRPAALFRPLYKLRRYLDVTIAHEYATQFLNISSLVTAAWLWMKLITHSICRTNQSHPIRGSTVSAVISWHWEFV